MVALDALDAGELCRVIGTFRDGLRSHQQLINRLNVYPVPDGDSVAVGRGVDVDRLMTC